MNTLTRLARTSDALRKIVEDEGGLELELSKKRVKTVLRIADQLDQVVFEQRQEVIEEMQAAKEREEVERQAAINHVTALAEEYGLAVKVLAKKPKTVHPKVAATSSEIRSWAKDNNIEVNPLGIIPKRVREAFELANA